jgi:hypothetical protein
MKTARIRDKAKATALPVDPLDIVTSKCYRVIVSFARRITFERVSRYLAQSAAVLVVANSARIRPFARHNPPVKPRGRSEESVPSQEALVKDLS